jgi:hypothetical protein
MSPDQIVIEAINLFHQSDKDLLNINDSNIKLHEVAISHRIAVYVEQILQDLIRSEKMSVDLEYNKHGVNAKILSNGQEFRPDIVVHKRGCDKNNFIVIEIKKNKHSNQDKAAAINKVKEATKPKNPNEPNTFGYQFGFVIEATKTELKIIYKT